ncbi:hypothetical protein N665_0408s0009 [Sinapis alba]|nr:hypothetical protein N665_0408s0009 [Sinapis alba]
MSVLLWRRLRDFVKDHCLLVLLLLVICIRLIFVNRQSTSGTKAKDNPAVCRG